MVSAPGLKIIFPGTPVGDNNALNTLAELRALSSTDQGANSNIVVANAGHYKWDPLSTAGDDGAATIKPDDKTVLQGGRWKRIDLGGVDRATLSGRTGASLIGLDLMPDFSRPTNLASHLALEPSIFQEGGYVGSPDAEKFLHTLYNLGSPADTRRTNPFHNPNYGFGGAFLGKGTMRSVEGFGYDSGVFGLNIDGVNMFASVLETNSASAKGLNLTGYVGVKIADLAVINIFNNGGAGPAHTSAGIHLDSNGGGGLLHIDRVLVQGFKTCIRQAPTNVGDGDKTMVTNSCLVGALHVYDQAKNKQAIGWTFINNNFGTGAAAFLLGGAGETCLINNIGNIYTDLIQFPEGAGNGGWAGPGHYIGQRVTVMSQKVEVTAPTNIKILNASACLKKTSAGPTSAAADARFRDLSISNAAHTMNELTNVIVQVGNETEGSDNIRFDFEGGNVFGVTSLGSNKTYLDGHNTITCAYRRMIVAPRPELAAFRGEGHHVAVYWRENFNVPLDQWRGGQGGNYTMEARKSFAVPTQGKYLIDTRSLDFDDVIGTRVGFQFKIPIPNIDRNAGLMGGQGKAVLPQLGLSVFMENPTGTENATSTSVRQFSDAAFTVPLGDAVIVPAGHRGLYFIHQFTTQPNNITSGMIYVEITKTTAGEHSEGVLLLDYHPYLGT